MRITIDRKTKNIRNAQIITILTTRKTEHNLSRGIRPNDTTTSVRFGRYMLPI